MLYLGFFAGFLLYIGAADVLPEAHSGAGPRYCRPDRADFLGAALIFVVTRFTG